MPLARRLAGLLLLAALAACVHNGEVQEAIPVAAPIGSYGSAGLRVVSSEAVGDTRRQWFQTDLTAKLLASGLFSRVADDATAPLVLQISLVDADPGNDTLRAIGGGGDAVVQVTVDLVDTAAKRSIGRFAVTATSAQAVMIGPSQVYGAGDRVARAFLVAADLIVAYLNAHKGATSAAPPPPALGPPPAP
jgi:hypothetical protein